MTGSFSPLLLKKFPLESLKKEKQNPKGTRNSQSAVDGEKKHHITGEGGKTAPQNGAGGVTTLRVPKEGQGALAIGLHISKPDVSASNRGLEHVKKAKKSHNCGLLNI